MNDDAVEKNHGIILFDGFCNYCSRWVDFTLRNDKKNYFRFASLQSTTGQNILLKKNIFDNNYPDSVVLIEDDKIFFKSAAGLRILKNLKFPFPVFYILIIFPKFIRDGVYDLVAKNRYKWFGTKEVCRVANTDEEKRKFLE